MPNPGRENHLASQVVGKTRTQTPREWRPFCNFNPTTQFMQLTFLRIFYYYVNILSSRESTEVEAAVSIIFIETSWNFYSLSWYFAIYFYFSFVCYFYFKQQEVEKIFVCFIVAMYFTSWTCDSLTPSVPHCLFSRFAHSFIPLCLCL